MGENETIVGGSQHSGERGDKVKATRAASPQSQIQESPNRGQLIKVHLESKQKIEQRGKDSRKSLTEPNWLSLRKWTRTETPTEPTTNHPWGSHSKKTRIQSKSTPVDHTIQLRHSIIPPYGKCVLGQSHRKLRRVTSPPKRERPGPCVGFLALFRLAVGKSQLFLFSLHTQQIFDSQEFK